MNPTRNVPWSRGLLIGCAAAASAFGDDPIGSREVDLVSATRRSCDGASERVFLERAEFPKLYLLRDEVRGLRTKIQSFH